VPGTNPSYYRNHVRTSVIVATVLLSVAACTGAGSNPQEDSAIPREDFVQAYYQLRVEGLRSPEMEISLEARNRILEDLGVTEDDLLNFAEVWGSDGEVMQEIWQEVDSLMREARRERAEDPSIEGYEPRRADTVPRGVGR